MWRRRCPRTSSALRPPSCCWSWMIRWTPPARCAAAACAAAVCAAAVCAAAAACTAAVCVLVWLFSRGRACVLCACAAGGCGGGGGGGGWRFLGSGWERGLRESLRAAGCPASPRLLAAARGCTRLHAAIGWGMHRARMIECTRASERPCAPLKRLYTIMVEFLQLSPPASKSAAACTALHPVPRCAVLRRTATSRVRSLRSCVYCTIDAMLQPASPCPSCASCRCWSSCLTRMIPIPM